MLPADDDITPIRNSLPPGPAAPVLPIVVQWGLLAAGGFAMRVNPTISQPPGVIQIAGLVAAGIATVLAIRMVLDKAVIARLSGGFGLTVCASEIAYLVWLLRRPGP